jgi:arylsulfatase
MMAAIALCCNLLVGYGKWRVEHAFAILPAVGYVSKHLGTYVEFPPRQKAGTFGLDQVLQKLQEGGD